jgi:spoIIIJ-associated protein
MESVELSAKSVEEAVQQALIRLGKSRDEVDVVVLSEGHKGILGFVRGDNARVRVTVRGSAPVTAPRETVAPPHASASRGRAPRPAARAPELSLEEEVVRTPARRVDATTAVPPKPSASALVARDRSAEKMGIVVF